MSNLDIIRGRSTVVNLTNQSGSARALGDVVVLDTANNESFTTSASSNYSTTQLGIVDEPISVGSNGRVVIEGYARQVNVNANNASRGNYLYQSTSAGVVAPSALNIPGVFGQFLKGGTGTAPSAVIFPIQGATAISAGSNATAVSGLSAAGVSALGSPSDHRHEGVFSITSSSSNTLQRPVVNIRAGANVGITATDTDGNGALDTLTIHSTGGGGGAGSSITHAFVGYNTIGGSTQTPTAQRQYMKSVTLAAAGIITSVGWYYNPGNGNTPALGALVISDSGGTPTSVLGKGFAYASLGSTAGGARWYHIPVGVYLAAGTYWIAIWIDSGAGTMYYDTSSSDKYATFAAATYFGDPGFVTITTDTNKVYSMRASFLSPL